MSRMNTANFPESMKVGLREVYQDELEDVEKEFRQWANVIVGADPGGESGKAFLEDLQVAGLGTFAPKPEGDPIQYDALVEGNLVRATPYTFGLGYRITAEAISDGRYGIFDNLTRQLARAAMHQMEVQSHRLLNNAFGTTGGTGHTAAGFDSLALISTAHVMLRGGTRANRLATDVDLSVTGVELLTDLASGWVNHSNMPTPGRLRTWVVPYQLQWVAREIFESELKPYTGNNEVNPIGGQGTQYIVSHYLTDPDMFFGLASKRDHSLNVWIRESPRFEMGDDFDTGDVKGKGTFRMASWHGEPTGIVGSLGA